MHLLRVAVPLALVAMTMPLPPAGAEDDDCKENDYGWGWEYPDCGFDCGTGARISVEAWQSYDNYVSGSAECGGGAAYCTDYDGRCGADGTFAGHSSVVGECQGTAYMGDVAYGKASVKCYSTGGHDVVQLRDIDGNLACPTASPSPPTAPPLGHFSLVAMDAFYQQDGGGSSVTMTGLLMNGAGCKLFSPKYSVVETDGTSMLTFGTS